MIFIQVLITEALPLLLMSAPAVFPEAEVTDDFLLAGGILSLFVDHSVKKDWALTGTLEMQAV